MSTPGRLDLLGDVLGVLESQRGVNDTMTRAFEQITKQVLVLWEDNADLRDELHALANRIERIERIAASAPVVVRHAPRVWHGYCRTCGTARNFTEGKCDVCAATGPHAA